MVFALVALDADRNIFLTHEGSYGTYLSMVLICASGPPHRRAFAFGASPTGLVEAGHAGFSIEAVARSARAGKPTIYRIRKAVSYGMRGIAAPER